MLLSRLDHQKGTRKILVDLLFKKGYCLCIPDPNLIKSKFELVPSSWIQRLLLHKNTLELSIIPMFMLIFIKNKSLTTDQSKRLLELIHVLLSQAEFDTIEEIFFENHFKQMAWVYYLLSELIKFTRDDFVTSDENSKRIMSMAASIQLFLDKANILTLTQLVLNTENIGFNVIQKLDSIDYNTLHPIQVIYLGDIRKKIISKTNFGILHPQELVKLKNLQEELGEHFFSRNKIIEFCRHISVSARCVFFNRINSPNRIHQEDEIPLGKNTDLLSSEYARLANYSTVSR
jgi:hypothetical protein